MASQVNGPGGMYKIKPYFDITDQIELPTCMYKMKNYHRSSDMSPQGDSSAEPLSQLERRQEDILAKLELLKSKVDDLAQKTGADKQSYTSRKEDSALNGGVVQDLVISANPNSPPLSIAVLYQLLSQQYSVITLCHTHSSVRSSLSDQLKQAMGANGSLPNRQKAQLALTLIWKDVKHGPTLMVSPSTQTAIQGEGPVARYLARLLHPAYDAGDIVVATETDQLIDMAAAVADGSKKEKAGVVRTLNSRLGRSAYLLGDALSLADIVLWSAIQRTEVADSAPANVKKWLERCAAEPAFGLALKML